jgi:hypothetical protein
VVKHIACGIAVVAIAAPAASATSWQAGHSFGTVVDGSRATLTGSATIDQQTGTSGVLASVRVQQNMTASSGLFQFGHLKVGANSPTTCGTSKEGFFIERRPPSGGFTCNFYPAVFGSQHKFSVLRAADGSGFSAYLDGNFFAGPWQIGFPSEGIAYAVGEYFWVAPTSFDFVWGPLTGDTPWQRTSDHGGTWFTVPSAGAGIFMDGPGWFVGTLPSPFHVSR